MTPLMLLGVVKGRQKVAATNDRVLLRMRYKGGARLIFQHDSASCVSSKQVAIILFGI